MNLKPTRYVSIWTETHVLVILSRYTTTKDLNSSNQNVIEVETLIQRAALIQRGLPEIWD